MNKEEAIKYLQQLYPNGGHCWLDDQRIEAIDMAIKALQEEPVSEKKCMFTNNNYTDEDRMILCEDCKEKCEYSKKEEPVSENSKKHISLVTERMLKEGPIPTLRGKEKADFENEFNRFKQITGMINWPSKEEIYKNVILWFIVWSRDHLKIGDIVDKSEIDKQPVSEDLKKAADNALESISDQYDIISVGSCLEMFRLGAQWQKEKEYTCYEEAFEDGAKWKKEQMMAKTIDAHVNYAWSSLSFGGFDWSKTGLDIGDKCKLIIIKED